MLATPVLATALTVEPAVLPAGTAQSPTPACAYSSHHHRDLMEPAVTHLTRGMVWVGPPGAVPFTIPSAPSAATSPTRCWRHHLRRPAASHTDGRQVALPGLPLAHEPLRQLPRQPRPRRGRDGARWRGLRGTEIGTEGGEVEVDHAYGVPRSGPT